MEELVLLSNTAQDSSRVLLTWFIHKDGLEATGKRRITLDVFLVLLECCRANNTHLTACKRGLQHIARVH